MASGIGRTAEGGGPCRSPRTRGGKPTPERLLAQTEALDQLVVAVGVLVAEILEQLATVPDHLQQSAARMVVFRVRLEMFGQVRDAVGQQRDLDLRGARVGFVGPELLDDVSLSGLVFGDVHLASKRLKLLTLFIKPRSLPHMSGSANRPGAVSPASPVRSAA